MKEFSIEEKAKRYDEAIERAKKWYNAPNVDKIPTFGNRVIEEIFPELKESEDELHRKWILEYLYDGLLKSDEQFKDQFKCAIAWFEKQGEQKLANKVEPKFKVGDCMIDKQGIVHQIANVIENVTNHTYAYDIVGGGYFNDNTEGVRLWTIQDAKDGDVLACENGWTCIFKTLVNDETFSSYCFMDNTEWFCETGSECHTLREEFIKVYNGKIHPATKEECDLLFQRMKEAGYEWDAEKKELKKIEQKPANWIQELEDKLANATPKQLAEWKEKYFKEEPTEWNDDFEEEIDRYIEENFYGSSDCILFSNRTNRELEAEDVVRIGCHFATWQKEQLKKLFNKQKSVWGEEDEKAINDIMWIIEAYRKNGFNETHIQMANNSETWLKSLKDRVQPKQEWSKEDENNILFLTSIIEECFKDKEKITLYSDTVCANFTKEDVIDRLKSLRPQNTWKPSDEQMNSLEEAINGTCIQEMLYSLYNDLKKLTE